MYYQNGNYMQDLNYYNQNPNIGYNPYANNYQNMNPQMPMGQVQQQNLNAMYPAVYRIISPVVSQVLSNNNMGYLTEDNLNSMVDTVYNIVEGDVNLANNSNPVGTTQANTNSNDSNCARNSSNSTPSSSNTSTSASTANGQNALLRDLIKIMILNEITARRQNHFSQMMMQNPNMNTNMFM